MQQKLDVLEGIKPRHKQANEVYGIDIMSSTVSPQVFNPKSINSSARLNQLALCNY
jgi:hypothetical protein